jgi:allophanate hydrolase subunit 1
MADQNINIKLLIDAAESARTVQETKKALRDLKTAALSVEEGSQAFAALTRASGQLQDKIGDLQATTKFLGDDLKNLKGFTSIASGIAGAFAAAQGAAALFGGENKQLEASLLKVQSAMSILQGIQAVGEVLQKESAASLLIQNGLRRITILLAGEQAVAEAAEAAASNAATISQRALNSAMNANPILAVIGLLVTAASVLLVFSNKSKDAAESQKTLNESIGKTKTATDLEIKTFNSQIESLKNLKTGSEDRAIVIKKINDQYGTTLKNLTDEKLFLEQINIAQNEYVKGAKIRLSVKIGEAKAEEFLKQAAAERLKNEIINSNINKLLIKQDAAKNANNIESVQRIQGVINSLKEEAATNEKVALGYISKADKVLDANAKLLTNETAKEKTVRELADENAKKEADRLAKLGQTTIDSAGEKAKKLADIDKEYYDALGDLSDKSSDQIIKNKKLEANATTEFDLVRQENLAIEEAQLIATKEQADELEKLVNIKIKQVEIDGKTIATPQQKATFTSQVKSTKEYQDFVIQSNKQLAQITENGQQKITDIEREYSKQRLQSLKELTQVALATDEYQRFIDFLNQVNLLEAQRNKFGSLMDQSFLSIKTIEDSKKQLDLQEKIIKSKERDVEYQKQINKELVESGLVTQQEVDKTITDIQDKNTKSLQIISELKKEIKDFEFAPKVIPTNTLGDLQKYYEKYKGQSEQLFDLGRKSNLDQLGNNKKSVEILSALYGEKFNIIKNAEVEINKTLEGSGNVFAIDPKEGQIGLSALFDLLDDKNKKLTDVKKKELGILLSFTDKTKGLQADLLKNYVKVSDEEQKVFDKALFQNYSNKQQQLNDNEIFLKKEEITKAEYDKNKDDINKKFNDNETTLKQNHEENLLAIGVVYGQKTQEDINTFGKARLAEKEAQAAKEQAIEDKKNAYLIQAGQSLYNTLRSQVDAFYTDKYNTLQQNYNDQVAVIDAELLDFQNQGKNITAEEQGRIDAEKQITDKKIVAQAEYDRKVREQKTNQFNINKAMDIIQIGINTAVAVSRALIAEKFLIPYIIGAGAAEAIFVAAQQPSFALGGLVTGPGGPKDDMVKANLSNGEVVINANSSKKYAKTLNAINQAGGGKPIPFRDGGMVNVPVAQDSNTSMEEFKSLILDIVSRPIYTYVKESEITNAQKSQLKQNRRTTF